MTADRPILPDVGQLRDTIRRYARFTLAKELRDLTPIEIFRAVSLAIRESIIERMLATERRYQEQDRKRVYYLSLEFLMGRSLENNLMNLGLHETCRAALAELGIDLEDVLEREADAALGNGGLGRLAACFLDSLASLDLPGFGYGINYEFGLFRQTLRDGWQQEEPDSWLARGTPWQIKRPDDRVAIPVYGRIVDGFDRNGEYLPEWIGWQTIVGVPHDMPVVGHGGRTVNVLRLFAAHSADEFDMRVFNAGDYIEAVKRKIEVETISKVLYPSDSVEKGKELRLLQEYFFVACAVRDIVRRFLRSHESLDTLPGSAALQMNDTHPALAVAELMRLLVDDHRMRWDRAFEITRATLAYTNHTLLPEALERWPISVLGRVLPRHLQIIREIDRRFRLEVAARFPGDDERVRRMAIVQEGGGHDGQLLMAHLAIVGSHSVNGVAKLHSELVKTKLCPDFFELWPERFNNKTNGVTHRRWLLKANPGLAKLLTSRAGDRWIHDLGALRALDPLAEEPAFRAELRAVKRANKERLARVIAHTTSVRVSPDALFDIQAKRIHEYKRQLLFAMFMVHEYLRIVEDGREPTAPRVFVVAGKAAPGYWAAKQIIKLINSIAEVVNHDARVGDRMKVAFIPDYRVSLAERIIPGADLSEQISTAGMEASGTGNMKFAMNGALTMGTLDGANIEIRDEVGAENVFIFGLRAEEIARRREAGDYRPRDVYESDSALARVIDAFRSSLLCPSEPGLFQWIAESLLDGGDPYFCVADFASYANAQEEAARLWLQPDAWATRAARNVARMGYFSSDRTIREYAREIWGLEPSATAHPLVHAR